MTSRKVKLTVNTNTNIRFLTALPADCSINRALPLLLNKYRTVVAETFGHHHALLRG